jgi:hypothetical protein
MGKTTKPCAPAALVAELDPLEFKALQVAGEKTAKALRPYFPVAKQQPIDVTVRLTGFLDVAETGETTETETPDTLSVLTIVLAHVKPTTRAAAFRALVETWADRHVVEFPAEAVELAKTAVALLTVRSKKQKNGAVSGIVAVQRVSPRLPRGR